MIEASYDPIAHIYDKIWGEISTRRYLPSLLGWLDEISPGSERILDLGCGTGQLTKALSLRGYKTTGIDISRAMILRARALAPDVTFEVANASAMPFSANSFDAAVSLFDTLNHLTRQELPKALSEINRVLRPGGLLVFDLNSSEGFRSRWCGSSALIRDDLVCATHTSYDSASGKGEYVIAAFERCDNGAWTRTDVTLCEWVHSEDAVYSSLSTSGFEIIKKLASDTELGIPNDRGRVFYLCRKNM